MTDIFTREPVPLTEVSNVLSADAKTDISIEAKISVFILGLCGFVSAWLIIYLGGFYHSPVRAPHLTTFVDGPSAVVMAFISLSLCATSWSSLLQSMKAKAGWYFLLISLVYLPPLIVSL